MYINGDFGRKHFFPEKWLGYVLVSNRRAVVITAILYVLFVNIITESMSFRLMDEICDIEAVILI